ATGDVLDSWRWLCAGKWLLAVDRWGGARTARRRGRDHDQPSPEHLRLPPSRRSWRREVRRLRQCWNARYRRGARVGAGQYRAVRRQSAQRDDLRRVRRGSEGERAPWDAVGEGTVSSRGDPERLVAAWDAARGCDSD